MRISDWSSDVCSSDLIIPAVAKAFYIATSGRPGPVLIDITKNAQNELIEETEYKRCESIRTYKPTPTLQHDDVEAAAELINKAKKPYLLVGKGVLLSGANEALKAFVDKTGIPVASTLLGPGSFSASYPNYFCFL